MIIRGARYREVKRVLGDLYSEYHQSRDFRALMVCLGDLRAWERSRFSGSSPLDDGTPWMNYPAIRRLGSFLESGMRVFEWGGGGSSRYFLRRGAELHTIEHDPQWARLVEARITEDRLVHLWTLRCLPPQANAHAIPPSNFDEEARDGRSRSKGFESHSFLDYCNAISGYADGYFDVVLIDGRARPGCLSRAQRKVRHGGLLVLDNSDRIQYQAAMSRVGADFARTDLRGLCPYTREQTHTTIWVRDT